MVKINENTEGVEKSKNNILDTQHDIKKIKKEKYGGEQSVYANPSPKAHAQKPTQAAGMRKHSRSMK
ncbi:MAG: hypothetical protein JNL70_02685 [Saprospiraceae bacterium]|nr:hypothetical protein [Saprospiraceae bacterium]